jgi:myo-inositol catabolism protein IolC
MPVEKSGREEFDFEFGDDFGRHVEAFDPTFAKVLVRYNPEGDAELNLRQADRLARLGAWLRGRGTKYLFELLVPATGEQLAAVGGGGARYDAELRPELVVRTIAECQAAIVLGRGADEAGVVRWLRAGAGVRGYVGFAVGRTRWWDELTRYAAGALSRDEAARSIAANDLRMVDPTRPRARRRPRPSTTRRRRRPGARDRRAAGARTCARATA